MMLEELYSVPSLFLIQVVFELSPYEMENISQEDQQKLAQDIEAVLQTLPTRDREIIELRFGFRSGHRHNLDEVGRCYGITRERTRQVEMRAIGRLRWLRRAKKIYEAVVSRGLEANAGFSGQDRYQGR